jgi:hypothetical protein
MYESRHSALLPRRQFFLRLSWHGMLACATLAGCLAVGMAGYHFFEHMGWVDAYSNASLILSGMGPLDPLKTPAGRIFAGTYALFSGVAFLTTVGYFLLPVLHRLLHRFHLESGKKSRDE